MMKRLPIFGIMVSLLFCSCKERINFDKVPHLEVVSFDKISDGSSTDKQAMLVLYFTDGDGNIGLDETFDFPPFDSGSVYENNLFLTYYAKRNGEFVAFPEFIFNARLLRFLSSDNPEPLEGTIERILDVQNLSLTSPDVDTVKFECWLADRDLNESNHVFTPEIFVRNR
jgi:hypothetical protein